MHMLRVEFTVACILFDIETSVRNVVPSSLRFVSEKNVSSVVPFQPSPHSLRQLPSAIMIRSFVEPMVERALKVVGMSVDVARELSLKTRHNVVESKSISRQVHPSGVSSKQSESLSWPKTIAFMPAGNIWGIALHVS
jgi:hypothetical protein